MRSKPVRLLIAALAGVLVSLVLWTVLNRPNVQAADAQFFIRPIVQLTTAARSVGGDDIVSLRWGSNNPDWQLRSRGGDNEAWSHWEKPATRRVELENIPSFYWHEADIKVRPGQRVVDYQLSKLGQTVFTATAKPRQDTDKFKFCVFGDIGTGSQAEKQIAYHVYKQQPQFCVLVGDIVYQYGRLSEYLLHFLPMFNHDVLSDVTGAPLLRSTPCMAVPGNHDFYGASNMRVGGLNRFPDGLAYFLLWKPPSNGPITEIGADNSPQLSGDTARVQAFKEAVGRTFPQAANYSFDYGNSHWAVIDANPYVDWTDKSMQDWLEKDLTSSQAKWKFVALHQPPFSSDERHFEEQHIRVLSPLFERTGVDIVFGGHVHNYQRSFPLKFAPVKQANGRLIGHGGVVEGKLSLDKNFDGVKNRRPGGVIYIITGGGGAPLYSGGAVHDKSRWQPFTAKYEASEHSFTVCEVNNDTMTLRQLNQAGLEIDHITISKALTGDNVTDSAPAPSSRPIQSPSASKLR